MRISLIALAVASLSISGCTATLPRDAMALSKPMSLTDVLNDVQCEIIAVYKTDNVGAKKAFKGLVAAGQFTTSGGVTLSGSPTVTLTPANVPASAKFPLGATASGTSTTSSEFDFNIDLDALAQAVGKDPAVSARCELFRERVVSKGLGISEHLSEAMAAVNQPMSMAVTSGLIHDVKFTATEGANGGLTFTTAFGSVDIGKPGFSNTGTNELKLTLLAQTGKGSGGGGGGGGKGSKSTQVVPFLFDLNKLIQVAPGQTVTVQ